MIRVASYCRVSTDQEDQANSFVSQQLYFRQYVQRQPDWELYEIYADEGITGTSTKKRAAFNRMIHDAYMGKFQLIITKEVSRFSRNILDTISFTRELKEIGVGVLFMNDGIHTLDPDAELRLSIMASIAQEESRKTSSRVKWGQTRQMERGVVFGQSLLGYDVKNGKLTVEPEGAALVRLIFHKYGVEKKGTSVIARELQEAGYRTYSGNVKWSTSQIVKMLKNEKYVGDLVQKKTITPDYLTHAKKYNHGEEEMIVIKSHHEPIIDRDLWNLVQSELKQRNRHGKPDTGHSNRYGLSGKIQCGACGATFVSRKKKRKQGGYYPYWCCANATAYGRRHLDAQGNWIGCDLGGSISDEVAMDMVKQVLAALPIDQEEMIRSVTDLAVKAIQDGEIGPAGSICQLEKKLHQLTKKKEAALDAFFSGSITKNEMELMKERYDKGLTELHIRLGEAKTRREVTAGNPDRIGKQVTQIIRGELESEVVCKQILKRMVVYPARRIDVSLNYLPETWIFREASYSGSDTGKTP